MKLVKTERFHQLYGFYDAYLIVLNSGRQVMVYEDYLGQGFPAYINLDLLDEGRFSE